MGYLYLAVGCRKASEVFAKLFYKKAVFWLLFSKSNITYKSSLFVLRGNFHSEIPFLNEDSVYVE